MNATRYKLPDWLGGGEVVVVPRPASADQLTVGGQSAVLVAFPATSVRIVVPTDLLTEVKPPLPPERDDLTIWHDPTSDDRDVWMRDDHNKRNSGNWFRLADSDAYPWREVCAITDPAKWVHLVPDPADDAPPLPFEIHDDTGHTALRVTLWPSLDKPRTGAVSVLGNYAELTADELKATAAALLRAARELDRASDELEAARQAAIDAMAKPGPTIVLTDQPNPAGLAQAVAAEIQDAHRRRPGYSHGAA